MGNVLHQYDNLTSVSLVAQKYNIDGKKIVALCRESKIEIIVRKTRFFIKNEDIAILEKKLIENPIKKKEGKRDSWNISREEIEERIKKANDFKYKNPEDTILLCKELDYEI